MVNIDVIQHEKLWLTWDFIMGVYIEVDSAEEEGLQALLRWSSYLNFFKAARHCSTDLERTPRPARRPSLRTTRFRHADCISHYSVLYCVRIIQYCIGNRSPPSTAQHHPRSLSSSFLSLSTTFFLRKSLSPNLQMLASSPKHAQDQTHIPSLVTMR